MTALMVKRLLNLSLRAVQGFMDSVFSLMKVPLTSPNYSSISKQAKTVDIPIKMPARGEIRHLAIDATGLKVFGEGEWKMKKHGKEQRRVWRKLHLAVDADYLRRTLFINRHRWRSHANIAQPNLS